MDPLAELHDIQMPEPVGWWPPAPFWWVIIALLLALLLTGIFLSVRRYRRNAYRREALRCLEQLSTNRITPERVNRILKAAAISAFGRHTCAALHGQAWLDFLRRTAPGAASALNSDSSEALGTASYQANPSYHPDELLLAAKSWIKKHRAGRTEARYV